MPQLDVASYLTQYIWVLLALSLLFVIIVLDLLPVLQQQFILRVWAEDNFKGKRGDNLVKEEGPTFILRGLVN
uniref:ATP synthase F0 subunit 8 n=1 Tax=Crella elegans TaxID=252961 RepID=A0A0H4KC14_CREEL|nr:ATP synthase F0 subunit 8 [Crella elegans]AKO90217.1 ATP synthase F0 subunit 8 [Crella elegans]